MLKVTGMLYLRIKKLANSTRDVTRVMQLAQSGETGIQKDE